MNVILVVLLTALAISLFIANRRGLITNEILSTLASIIGIVAGIAAVLVFIVPAATSDPTTPSKEPTVGKVSPSSARVFVTPASTIPTISPTPNSAPPVALVGCLQPSHSTGAVGKPLIEPEIKSSAFSVALVLSLVLVSFVLFQAHKIGRLNEFILIGGAIGFLLSCSVLWFFIATLPAQAPKLEANLSMPDSINGMSEARAYDRMKSLLEEEIALMSPETEYRKLLQYQYWRAIAYYGSGSDLLLSGEGDTSPNLTEQNRVSFQKATQDLSCSIATLNWITKEMEIWVDETQLGKIRNDRAHAYDKLGRSSEYLNNTASCQVSPVTAPPLFAQTTPPLFAQTAPLLRALACGR